MECDKSVRNGTGARREGAGKEEVDGRGSILKNGTVGGGAGEKKGGAEEKDSQRELGFS